MEVSRRNGQIEVRMDKYINSLLEEGNGNGRSAAPAREDLFKRDQESPRADKEQGSLFRRKVARLLYLAKRVAPEMLLAVSYLSTLVNDVRER
jgi:hypothetical protein